MEQTFLWCPIEQELLENIDPHPCEYCGDGCEHCPPSHGDRRAVARGSGVNASERLSVSAASQAPLQTGATCWLCLPSSRWGGAPGPVPFDSFGGRGGLPAVERPNSTAASPTEAGFNSRLPEHLLRS